MLTPEQIEQVALTCLPCGGKGYTAELVWMKRAITLALEMDGADVPDVTDCLDPHHEGFGRALMPQEVEARRDEQMAEVLNLCRSISNKEQQMTLDITGIKNSLSGL